MEGKKYTQNERDEQLNIIKAMAGMDGYRLASPVAVICPNGSGKGTYMGIVPAGSEVLNCSGSPGAYIPPKNEPGIFYRLCSTRRIDVVIEGDIITAKEVTPVKPEKSVSIELNPEYSCAIGIEGIKWALKDKEVDIKSIENLL